MIKRKTPLKRTNGHISPKKRVARRITPKKGQSKGLPSWIKAIPEGRHGSGTLQKRLWRLTSDFVRIRDWTAFQEYIDTGEKIIEWNDAQAGHWRSYAECRGMFKFHEMNIHAQTAKGNSWPTSTTWDNYRRNLISRYSEEFMDSIDKLNKNWPLKITTPLVLKEIERKLKLLSQMKEKPPYYERVMKLKTAAPIPSLHK